jgi:hypothetical protein
MTLKIISGMYRLIYDEAVRMYIIYIHIKIFTGQRFPSGTARLTAGHENDGLS